MVRLIDADKLEAYGTTVPKECNAEDYLSGVRDVLEHIDSMPTIDAIPVDFITEFKEDYCTVESEKCDIGIANALVELMLCWEDEQEGLEWRNDHERIPSKQQSVDAVPVRHGKWENSRPDAPMFGFYYCSLCGRKRTSPQDRYCPTCGADMRGTDNGKK